MIEFQKIMMTKSNIIFNYIYNFAYEAVMLYLLITSSGYSSVMFSLLIKMLQLWTIEPYYFQFFISRNSPVTPNRPISWKKVLKFKNNIETVTVWLHFELKWTDFKQKRSTSVFMFFQILINLPSLIILYKIIIYIKKIGSSNLEQFGTVFGPFFQMGEFKNAKRNDFNIIWFWFNSKLNIKLFVAAHQQEDIFSISGRVPADTNWCARDAYVSADHISRTQQTNKPPADDGKH